MDDGIELKQLRYFHALAEELHFGRAARRCGISQPPFSIAIQKLERDLGVKLVERTSRAVRLTPAGLAFYGEAGKSIAQVAHAREVATRVSAGEQGVIKVGFFTSMIFRHLEAAIAQFRRTRPRVELQLVELNTNEQLQAVRRREVQYGFVHATFASEDLVVRELVREPLVLCLPRRHPACRGPSVDLAALRQESFITFARDKSPALHDQVVALCVKAGFAPRIPYEARNWLTVLACVARGMGVALVPRSLVDARVPGLVFRELGAEPMKLVVSTVWHAADEGDPVIRSWHRTVLDTMGAPAKARRRKP